MAPGRVMVTKLYEYRRFIWQRALLDLRLRYADTGMGLVWNVIHPLMLILTYTFVFTQILGQKYSGGAGGNEVPYVLFICSGLVPWTAFSDSIQRGANCFRTNAAYLRKLPVPEQVFVAQTAVSATISLGISFGLLMVISILLGHMPTVYWLLLPLPLVGLQLMGFGIGLACGTLCVFFRDLVQLIPLILRLAMWLAPVLYPLANIPSEKLRWLIGLHPVSPHLDSIHRLFLDGRLPDVGVWMAQAGWIAATLVLGFVVLRLLRAEIRDVL